MCDSVKMKTQTLSTRVDAQLVERLDRFEIQTGVERASLIRSSITAALDYYEEHGSIAFPLYISDSPRPKSSNNAAKRK